MYHVKILAPFGASYNHEMQRVGTFGREWKYGI